MKYTSGWKELVKALELKSRKLANDPPVSEKQRRAMYAAANGKSTLGIPKKVGKEFIAKDEMPLSMRISLALDRASIREKDTDGRLHVDLTPISKATVNPYLGSEIPGADELGLDASKVYQLFRDPKELEKAASTFNNLPLLSKHVPVSADDHPKDIVVGSTGTDAVFEAPYLKNTLVVWTADAIASVESGKQKELSCAYRYRADMKPGTFEGQSYDGVMRDIVGNHVALVREGRAGPDVVVGDSKENMNMKTNTMTRKAAMVMGGIYAYLLPKMAADAKFDLTSAFADVTSKNFNDKKTKIGEAVTKLTLGHLAKDASLEDLPKVIDAFSKADPVEAKDDDLETKPNNGVPPFTKKKDPAATDEDPIEEIKTFLKGKLSSEDMAQLDEMVAKLGDDEEDDDTAQDEDKDDKDKKAKDDKEDDKDNKNMKDTVTKSAMDAAINAASKLATTNAIKLQRDIRDAERAVRPFVGELNMSFDSAAEVYRHALKMRGVKEAADVHESALPILLKNLPKPSSEVNGGLQTYMAADSASNDTFDKMFPTASKIGFA